MVMLTPRDGTGCSRGAASARRRFFDRLVMAMIDPSEPFQPRISALESSLRFAQTVLEVFGAYFTTNHGCDAIDGRETAELAGCGRRTAGQERLTKTRTPC